MKRYFTSESVCEGHPDKVCDRISDAVLDEMLKNDPDSRVACECSVTTGLVLVMGEITTNCYVDINKVVRDTIKEIGYNDADVGFDYHSCAILTHINKQSDDIALGVDNSLERKNGGDIADQYGAGDQGMMFGYACKETPEYMPLPIMLAHKMCERLSNVRKEGLVNYLRPDGKGQVTVEYNDGKATRIDTIVLSAQHNAEVTTERLRKDIKKLVIDEVMPKDLIDENTKIYINPTGRFEIGGPNGDSGLTGRKIIVDTYGGRCAHGGGAFSGKDPTKVDRSAAYMARYIAKNMVASGLADEVEIQIAYAIGVAKPVSIFVDTKSTGKLSDEKLAEIVNKEFDLRPYSIIKTFDLKRPIYSRTSAYGHFGKDYLPWEKLDRVDDLKKYLK